MADVIRKATNRFTKGLVMDFSPENTKNELLTHALNATLLTFNGNELSLQNDMGNGRVETAYLPDGYMPVGTCEYGGIIYIVSYNPLEDKSQIGCFPSPERNISNDELGIPNPVIKKDYFQEIYKDEPTGNIKHNTQYVLLKNDKLNPGDKFIVTANKEIYNEKLADLWVDKDWKHYAGTANDPEDFELVSNPIIALNVVSIEDSGKIIYLNSDIRHYDEINTFQKFNETYGANQTYNDIYRYHILGKMSEKGGVYDQASVDLDNYRDALNSGYSVFKSKTSGKLAILAELIMIDSYSVTHSVVPKKDGDTIIDGAFDIVIHTEITPELTNTNYNIAPKLKYYYLENSQGNIQVSDIEKGSKNIPLFKIDDTDKTKERWIYNSNFFGTSLSSIYVPTDVDNPLNLSNDLKNTAKFGFPLPKTYHGKLKPYGGDISGTANESLYTKFEEGKYHRIDKSQVQSNWAYYEQEIRANFFYYDSENSEYTKYEEKNLNESYTYFIRKPNHIYHDVKRNEDYRYAELYILATQPLTASDTQKKDTTIEKFQKQEIHSYTVATNKDIEEGKKLYYSTDGGSTYIQLTGTPEEGVTYYTLKVEETLVSVGFEDATELTGTVYYFPSTKEYSPASEEEIKQYFDFETYPLKNEYPYGCPITLYHREEKWLYEPATEEDKLSFTTEGTELYYNTSYILVEQIQYYNEPNQLFIVVPMDVFVDSSKFIPNESYNWIEGRTKPSGTYTKDDPISLYTLCDFIPQPDHDDSYLKYNDVKLANIKLPSVVSVNGLDLPFKYDYTIVPCMNYGKLQHLAVSNTVDFSKLHAFNQSEFTTWKYRIDNDQLRLTFGADIFDTYEQYKVDGLILEFYDCWGFAGSIEISDKKSYSGIFTKIIPLNSYRAINTKGIHTNSDYARNVNIKYEKTKNPATGVISENYLYNEKNISFKSPSSGWSGIPTEEGTTDNDCGTLYSNMIYGVKTYLRRDIDGSKEYIRKRDFFLFTLPIYNDYYYTLTDFSNIKNPELELMLTYKLKDSSEKTPYTQGEIISNGYNTQDNKNVENYLRGFYQGVSLDLIRYYQYKGTTELFLEIGLKKDYEALNLSYDPEINKKFSCNLRLVSDEDPLKTFTINSGVEGLNISSETLNYKDIINESVNTLGFETNKPVYNLVGDNFRASNFINIVKDFKPVPLKINYNYVVGYTAKIDKIRSTQVQATTICALCHKQASEEYNYEDFGVYEQVTTDAAGNEVRQLLSNAIFYNEGTETKEVFGLCKQIAVTGNMSNQLSSFAPVETDATEIKTAGKLNSGDPLKQLVGQLGKLTFCQPHAHGFSEINGVNIHEGNGTYNYGIPSEAGGGSKFGEMDSYEDTWGIAPRDFLYKNPKYNLCVNTKNSINYNSEFISSMDYKEISSTVWLFNCDNNDEDERNEWYGPTTLREFVGMTGQELAQFNTKLIQTMKGIYAYNPGYDYLTVNVGNITLQDYNPYFTSNLINEESSLNINETNNEFFNDYIKIGPISITDYLINLNKYSRESEQVTDRNKSITIGTFKDAESTVLSSVDDRVKFIPNFNYCGTKINPYLITSLTYNTPVPQELEQELEFSASDMNVIKHADGTNTYLKGVPNKKALYGYNAKYDKMIQLDVSNYSIENDGTLVLKDVGSVSKYSGNLNVTSEMNKTFSSGNSYDFKFKIVEEDKEEEIDLYFSLSASMMRTLQSGDDGFFVGMEFSTLTTPYTFYMVPSIHAYSKNKDFNYQVKVDSIEFESEVVLLNNKISLYGGNINLYEQPYETLCNLVSPMYYGDLGLVGSGHISQRKYDYEINQGFDFSANDTDLYGINTVTPDNYGNITFKYVPYHDVNSMENPYGDSYVILLVKFDIKKVNFTVTKTSKLETDPNTFISTTRTTGYWEKINHKYTVKEKYKNAQIKGTSITLNDLIYEPNQDGHRLFMRNNLWNYDSNLRGKLYYRLLDIEEGRKSWYYNTGKYLNNIFLFTGPCFTPDTLNK